jgi:hypothetical protein
MYLHSQQKLTDNKELFPVPGLTFHALGGAKVQTTSGAQDDSTPKIERTNAFSCACPSVTFRPPCIAEDSQTQKKKYTSSVRA